MGVYAKARQVMRMSGNLRQWTGGYPSKEKILEDIGKGRLYVVRDGRGAIHACFVMAVMDDPTYHIIEGGYWSADRPYAVIHRIGQDGTMNGILHLALTLASQVADYIRIIQDSCRARSGAQECDPLLAAQEKYKAKKGYGGKQQ